MRLLPRLHRDESAADPTTAPAPAPPVSDPRDVPLGATAHDNAPTEVRARSAREDRLAELGRDVERRAAEEHRAPASTADPAPTAITADTDADHAPDAQPERGPAERTGVFATLKRTLLHAKNDGLTDWAAALTYYGLLALFPAIIALVSIVGLVADPESTTRTLTDVIQRLAPGSATDTITGPIQSITEHPSRAGVLLVFGIGAALWSASGYVGALMRASNAIFDVEEGRPFWKLRPLQLVVTLVLVVMAILMLSATVLTGPVVEAIADPLGIGQTAVDVWDIAKWPVMALVALAMISFLYWATPNVEFPRFRLITPGAGLALGVALVASAGFGVYVANFGSYDKTYGTLGGLISLLVWLWICNVALLLGQQLNAELERDRELRAGVPDAGEELDPELREAPKPE